jgi:hypothetical protein
MFLSRVYTRVQVVIRNLKCLVLLTGMLIVRLFNHNKSGSKLLISKPATGHDRELVITLLDSKPFLYDPSGAGGSVVGWGTTLQAGTLRVRFPMSLLLPSEFHHPFTIMRPYKSWSYKFGNFGNWTAKWLCSSPVRIFLWTLYFVVCCLKSERPHFSRN